MTAPTLTTHGPIVGPPRDVEQAFQFACERFMYAVWLVYGPPLERLVEVLTPIARLTEGPG